MSYERPQPLNESDVLKVKEKYEKKLLCLNNVVGVGIGYKIMKGISKKRLCIKVYVEKKLPRAELSKDELIPEALQGIETDVEELGRLSPK